jgi:hypothetical protein
LGKRPSRKKSSLLDYDEFDDFHDDQDFGMPTFSSAPGHAFELMKQSISASSQPTLPAPNSTTTPESENAFDSMLPPLPPPSMTRKFSNFAQRQGLLLGRRVTSHGIQDEWEAENDARGLYGAEPPAELPDEEDLEDIRNFNMPPPSSVLNNFRQLSALQKLAVGGPNAFSRTVSGTPSMPLREPTKKNRSTLGKFMVPVRTFFNAVTEDAASNDGMSCISDASPDAPTQNQIRGSLHVEEQSYLLTKNEYGTYHGDAGDHV